MKKIALCLILGNEEDKIERLLNSFKGSFDYISAVIAVGNQKQDETLSVLQKWCSENSILYHWEIYKNITDWPHLDNFGGARQLAWENAQRKFSVDLLMWADADDALTGGGAEKIREIVNDEENKKYDAFVFEYDTGREVTLRERIVLAGISDWKHCIHEQLKFRIKPAIFKFVEGVKWIHKPTLESRPNSFNRNERILSNALEDTGRNAFYLHQQCFQLGQESESRKWGQLALASPDVGIVEAYEIKLNLSQMEKDPAIAKSLALEAFGMMADRREALCLLCEYYLLDGNKYSAYGVARAFINMPLPPLKYWSLNRDLYSWKGLDLFCRAARFAGVDEKEIQAHWFGACKEMSDSDTKEPIISVIHATFGRPDQAVNIRNLWLSRAKDPRRVEYLFGVHSFDSGSVLRLRGYRHSQTDKKGAGPNLEACAAKSTGAILIQAQDDILPPQDWDQILIDRFEGVKGPAFMTVSDGHRKDQIHVTSVMNREYMEIKAKEDCEGCGFGHPAYFSMYWDTENSYRAYKDGEEGIITLIDGTDTVFFHDHPTFVKGKPWDETYKIENAPEHYEEGQRLFYERNPGAKEKGW
jgi:glycosyltransferase involved in cell wall biosynthesis